MKNKFKVNDLVVVDHEIDSVVYRVVEVNGLTIGVITNSPEFVTYWDYTLFKTPTIGQMKQYNFVNN